MLANDKRDSVHRAGDVHEVREFQDASCMSMEGVGGHKVLGASLGNLPGRADAEAEQKLRACGVFM